MGENFKTRNLVLYPPELQAHSLFSGTYETSRFG